MSKKRGTSNVPMVLGIVGGVLGLPASFCSGACAAVVEEGASTGLTEFYLFGTMIVSILLIVLSCFTKKFPVISGILMIVCTVVGFILFLVTANMLGIIAMILTLIASILSLVQKKEIIQ